MIVFVHSQKELADMAIFQFFRNLLGLGSNNSQWDDEGNKSDDWDNISPTYPIPDSPPPIPDSPPPIPEQLNSRQFSQKQLVAGVEALIPEILEKSKTYGDMVQIFIAIAFIETIEDTPAKFFFTLESGEEATTIILEWAQAYQDKNYMLPPLMATVHWGFTPIIW